MLYKFKMFFLWIYQNLLDYIRDNAEGIFQVMLLYSVIFTFIFGFIDLGLADSGIRFLGEGWLSIILRLIAYPSMIFYIYWFLDVAFHDIRQWLIELKRDYIAFTIEGPKRKKKDNDNWIETPEHLNQSNPLDSINAADFYFDDKGVFKDDQFDEDFQRHLDEISRKHRGSKT